MNWNRLLSVSLYLLVAQGVLAARLGSSTMMVDSPVGVGGAEKATYEGEDERDGHLSMKRDYSDFDLKACDLNSNQENDHSVNKETNIYGSYDTATKDQLERKTDTGAEEGINMIPSGHASDPGTGKAEFWSSPKLLRSCSNMETREVLKKMGSRLPHPKSQSFEEIQNLANMMEEEVPTDPRSTVSPISQCSADKVMLKKHSSSQMLPSRSHRLWWKLFLWSHRNIHMLWSAKQPLAMKLALNQQGGYSSDTLEPRRGMELCNSGSPMSFTGESFHKDSQRWEGFHGRDSGLWPENQWVAFSAESSAFTRVDEWVAELPNQSPIPTENEDYCTNDSIVFPPSPGNIKSLAKSTTHSSPHPNMSLSEEIVHANSVIQSINSSSTVAHIAAIGLKVIPTISCFSSLRSVNSSGNFIVRITPGSLPKGLHALNLSRNNINAIEGLRELTRLRLLDLSYNRISRIGQGLSNCTLIKELYLAGNKLSDVEGLHRLLKLTILDLSFNKITTTKALGQLVANYNSLVALNLLGNPIQSNIGDDHLRKAICSLLPKLAYLNKQPINPQKAREVATEAAVKAALGNSSWRNHRKAVRRVSQGGSSYSTGHRSSKGAMQRSRHRSRYRTRQCFFQKTNTSTLASSSQ